MLKLNSFDQRHLLKSESSHLFDGDEAHSY